jgi:hypothetical protein
MLPRLADPDVYERIAERIRKRQRRSGELRPLVEHGPSLLGMETSLPALARRLARHVSQEHYAFGPVTPRPARVGGKERMLYACSPLDQIVLGALATTLTELLEPSLRDCLYSYRPRRSARQALLALRAYLRSHSRARSDPRERGLYVLRRDIQSYGDALPVGPDSALWSLLAKALARAGAPADERTMSWLRGAFRPPVQRAGLLLPAFDRGVPTGSPLQPLACNLYLSPLDDLCAGVPNAFYARYGDDVVFAHPDLDCARAVQTRIDACLAGLGLVSNPHKSAGYYFTRPGRPSADASFKPASSIDYLGVRVDFRGTFGLKRDKLNHLLSDVSARLSRSAMLLQDTDLALREVTLSAVARVALDPQHPLAHRSALSLAEQVDDRGQLRDLDYKLARLLAESLTGDRSPRALRRYPPRRLRELGLPSLVHRRDQSAGRRA